jgi:hypothetical protein
LQSSWNEDHHFSSSSDWNIGDLRGLDWTTDGNRTGKHDVHFTIARDAGTVDCEGFVRDGAGAGLFTFRSNPQYSREMDALGFSGVDEERLFSFAIHDVSLAFARDIKAAGVSGVDADDLRKFRIHGVTPEYVNELARLGYAHPEAHELIALRIHRVTPEYIEHLRARGVQNLTLRQLVTLRIHGID